MRRSMLFLPGNTPNMIIHGDSLGADAIILDLEDAVAPDEKDAARILVRNALKYQDFGRCETIVRINGLDTSEWQLDLQTLCPLQPDFIMPPKVGSAEDILKIDHYLSQLETQLHLPPNAVGLIALLETALGIENAFAIASASSRVKALFLGGEDLTADLHCQRTAKGEEIRYARSRLVCAARAAGIDAYDTPFTDVNDDEGIWEDAQFARSLGFTGKAAISPRHVKAINQVFSPSEKEIAYAYEVMEVIQAAKEQGRGAVSLRGKMIDAPIVERAKQTIAMAQALQEIGGSNYV